MPPQVLVNATARPRTAELFTSVVKLRFNICTFIRISRTSLNDLSPYKNTSQAGTPNETHAIGAWPRSALTAELQSSHLHQRWSASRSAVLRCACCTIRAAIPNKTSRVGLVPHGGPWYHLLRMTAFPDSRRYNPSSALI